MAMLICMYNMCFMLFSLSFIMGVACFWINYVGGGVLLIVEVLNVSCVNISLPFLLDEMSCSFSSLVYFISASVALYSVSYIEGDRFISRFIMLVVLFVLSINLLIFVPSALFLLVGWDGLGVVSFLLIIYYQNSYSLSGGIVTALTNRIGDVLLIISFMFFIYSGGLCMWSSGENVCFLGGFLSLVLVGCFTKSAQIPFSSWLPMAIAAPTPVSALVHSSTLVTAGVYLLIRFNFYFGGFSILLYLILFFSSITILLAGFAALLEIDVKNIVALSTLSQLGFIVFSISMMLPELAYYHLLVHALFKALIFMSIGVFIHSCCSQDLRLMGGFLSRLPFCSFVLVWASISICGFPFLSGFFSNDLIIEGVISINNNVVVDFVILLGVLLTVLYSCRMCYYVVFNITSGYSFINLSDISNFYVFPMVLLLGGGVIGGVYIRDFFLDCCLVWVVSIQVKFLPIMCLCLGLYWSCGFWEVWSAGYTLNYFVVNLLFLNFLSTQYIVNQPLNMGYNIVEVDQGWFELLGGQGLWCVLSVMSLNLQMVQELLNLPLFFSLVIFWLICVCLYY